MIDGAQTVAANDNGFAMQAADDVPDRIILSQRCHQSSHPFNHQQVTPAGQEADLLQRGPARHAGPASGRGGGRQRSVEIKRVDIIERQTFPLQAEEKPGVAARAGAKRFHGQGAAPAAPEEGEQHRRQHCFPGAGVRARDKKKLFHTGGSEYGDHKESKQYKLQSLAPSRFRLNLR